MGADRAIRILVQIGRRVQGATKHVPSFWARRFNDRPDVSRAENWSMEERVTYRLENGGKALSLEKYTEHCVGDMESFLEAQPAFDRVIMRNEVRWRLHLEFTSKEKSMLKEAMGLDISVKKVAEPRMSHTFARSPRFKPRGVASRASLPARHTQRDAIGHEKSSPSAFFPKAQFDLMAITSETPGPGFYASQAFATPRRHRSETSMPESRAQTFQRFYDRQLEYARSKTVLARVRREEEQRRRAGSPTNRSSRSPGTARKPVSGTTSPDK